jgi:hypothetical protein
MNDNEAPITIGGVPIPADLERHHVLLTGAPATGKTVAIREMLRAIRLRGDAAVIYAPMDELRDLYDPARDLIVNPGDPRHQPDVPVGDLAGRFVFLTHNMGDDMSPARTCHARLIERVVAQTAHAIPVWLVLNEPSYKLPADTIEAALADGSGVTVIAAAQFLGQLQAYGHEALWAVPRTRLTLCIREPETAKLVASELGVEPSVIMTLPTLTGYLTLRMEGGLSLKTDVQLEA